MKIDLYFKPVTDLVVTDIRAKLEAAIDKELRSATLKHMAITKLQSISHYKQVNSKIESVITNDNAGISAHLQEQWGQHRLRLTDYQWGQNMAEWTLTFPKGISVARLIELMQADVNTETYQEKLSLQFAYLSELVAAEHDLRQELANFQTKRQTINFKVFGTKDSYYHESIRNSLTALTAQ